MCTSCVINNTKTVLSGIFLCLLLLVSPSIINAQDFEEQSELRTFDEIFPGLDNQLKEKVFSGEGFLDSYKKNVPMILSPSSNSGIDLKSKVIRTSPPYLAESLMVIPYSSRVLTKLDAYNSLGKIRDLKGRLYHSFSKQEDIILYEEATRVESERKNNAIPDPMPASVLPASETLFIKLKDSYFGNTYYRGDFLAGTNGVTYALTNYKTISYLLFSVMKEENFSAILYMEPLQEGMMIYCAAGAHASDFIASKTSISSVIEKRLAVIIEWVRDGLIAIK